MRWLLALGVVVLLAVAGVAIAARDGGEEKKTTKGTDLTAIRCPLEQTGETPDGEPKFEPAEDAFDTAELVGLKLADANAKAAEHGCEIVVSLQDGVGVPVPIDVDPERIYVYTEKDVVTTIEGVGGGL
jgi:hypothetical protein